MTDQSNERRGIDPSFLRGALMPRLTRRDLLKATGVGMGAVSLSAILAACGVKGETPSTGGTGASDVGSPAWWKAQKQVGHVNFTNWPQYIDIAHDAQGNRIHPSLVKFTETTGIDVTYRADINDNTEFYAQIRPALEAGQDTGSDIIVITNGVELTEMIELGYLIPLDRTRTPNFDANAGETIRDPAYDPGNKYTLAWQSGFTGIGWNTKYIDRDITSFMDLFDPAFSGKIGMMGNNADLPGLALLAVGVDPETSVEADWKKAAALLQKQRDSGVVRKYYVQDYLTAFENEDIWISMAWSGDILIDQLYYDRPEFRFALPKEGAMIWTDNMCIPQAAAAPLDALMLMDWYYDPKIAAGLTEYNNYVGPVPAAQKIVQSDANKATGSDKQVLEVTATSPYVFPTDEVAQMVHNYRVLTPDEEPVWNSIFEPIYQS